MNAVFDSTVVAISTDAGITGWGEMLKDDAKACAAGAQEVGRYLIGQDPNRVVFHWEAIHRGSFYRGGPIKTAIFSGNTAKLYNFDKHAERAAHDRFAEFKADYLANGPGRSNLRYGYVRNAR